MPCLRLFAAALLGPPPSAVLGGSRVGCWRVRPLALVAVLAALGACSDSLAPATPTSIRLLAGDHQTGPVGAALPQPITVRVTDANGVGVPNVTVTWTPNSINGVPSGTAGNSSVVTDANGVAQVLWILGDSVGVDSMAAAVSGISTTLVPVTFVATATAGAAAQVVPVGATGLNVAAGSVLMPRVMVVDQYGNPVAGVPVMWAVVTGGGGVDHATTTTDATGQTQVTWTLGPAPGALNSQNNSVTATVGTLPPATITATGT